MRAAARQAAVPTTPALNATVPSAARPTPILEIPGAAVLSASPSAGVLPTSPPETVGHVTTSPVSPIPQLDGAYTLPSLVPASSSSSGDATALLPQCPNCEQPMSSSHQCNVDDVSSSESDSVIRKTEMLNLTPARPRRLNMMKFCDNCDTLHQSGLKCPSCYPAKPVPP